MLRLNKGKGLTLLEIVISLSLIAVALLGVFQIINVGLTSVYKAQEEIIVTNLARGLMSEIMGKAFEEAVNPVFGPEPGETRLGGATGYDDIDDYNNFTEILPTSIGGIPLDGTNIIPGDIPDCRNFTWSVGVSCVDANMAEIACPVVPDFKKVTVTVDSPRIPNVTLVEVKAR